ncbi:G-protein coupled receptor family C group 5 member C-like isoform X1 [Polyodon spathula]|uniref:G-protein coupled receptor family C group 5 member C-like isoform X1 n=1 Tax=Polyodon spathula TaxID=7913 RepID=UPI001B7F6E5C|nr:G-protein coupled receptor family C group 5 member C-like isoform X1 [Polyodon spathula]XP_041078324.1 G-protein coupled receptor family C group 5 member C-like isoform X1 [Polyodon spathula]
MAPALPQHFLLVALLFLFQWTAPVVKAQTSPSPPSGCGQNVNPLYYNLCDLTVAWGVVLEAFAGAGMVGTFMVIIVLVASLPFVTDGKKKSVVGLQVGFLLCTLGLFALTFDFIVKPNFSTCASRRFLFGVLFAGCFSCLLVHSIRLNLLVRKDDGPRGWVLCLGALALWLVEVIINTEWLIITIVRNAPNTTVVGDPCSFANMDFVMALIYVMVLLLATLVSSVSAQMGKHKRWRKHGIFILLTALLSIGMWVAWIVMYVFGNSRVGSSLWDDPTLAIALVSNAWTFLILYIIPELCLLTKVSEAQPSYGDELYPTRGVGYETILKEQTSQSMFVENKAFSMDEPSTANKTVSPYCGYNGQNRNCVYQPTELALISKGPELHSEVQYEGAIPRASVISQPASSNNSTVRAEDAASTAGQQRNGSGNSFYSKSLW